jgi:hypothetical protein
VHNKAQFKCLQNTSSSPSLQPLVSQTLSIIPATEKYENQLNITNTEYPVHSHESRDVKMILNKTNQLLNTLDIHTSEGIRITLSLNPRRISMTRKLDECL